MRPGDPGRSILTFEAPARGLIGFRSLLLTATRGTALMHQHHAGWMPWAGELPHRKAARMISDRAGTTTGYALDNLQARGEFFLGPGTIVYEGMVVGESARPGRHGHQRRAREGEDQHPHPQPRRGDQTQPAANLDAGDCDRVHRRGRVGRGDPIVATRSASDGSASTNGAGWRGADAPRRLVRVDPPPCCDDHETRPETERKNAGQGHRLDETVARAGEMVGTGR